MSRWSPYKDNGGTALAIAGPDYGVLVADTRCSSGYSILSRHKSKMVRLTDKTCLVSCGQQSDVEALHKKLKLDVHFYQFEHGKQPDVHAIAQRLSVELYSRRFFPYYAFNILCGIDENNEGVVYSYDAVGSSSRAPYGASGSAAKMVYPVLDLAMRPTQRTNQTQFQNSVEESVKLGIDALTAAVERDIHTGDFAEVWIISANGLEQKSYPLRQD